MCQCRVDVGHRRVSDTGTRLIQGVFVLHRSLVMISVARTLLIEGVSRCPTRVVSNTDTCNYIELCCFLKILSVSTGLCLCFIDRCSFNFF